jgi:hypothetical protein
LLSRVIALIERFVGQGLNVNEKCRLRVILRVEDAYVHATLQAFFGRARRAMRAFPATAPCGAAMRLHRRRARACRAVRAARA